MYARFFKMPRPGPRPYECVRRAWHSDRHPPIRGSLIREIFRISNEVHSSTTRKNREWLEKLPTVVLKAEEIMYSRANTEAEYSDHQTLWDRLNDAIDTIIRRDESTESGQLQPCIEAALILGCAPRRSSRSQRNKSPRCYLKPQNAGACSVPHSSSPSDASGNYTKHTPVMLHSPQHFTHKTINSPSSFLKADNQSIRNRNQNEKRSPGLSKNCAPYIINQHASLETYVPPNTWSIYPLYYENHIQPADVKSTNPSNSCTRLMECLNIGASDAPHFVSQSNKVSPSERKSSECDLTLRLGCTAVPCSSPGNAPSIDMDHSNSRTYVEGGFSRAVPTTDTMLRLPFGRFG